MISPHARNDGGGGSMDNTRSGSDSKIQFTFMFDKEVRSLTISQNETVAALEEFVCQEFRIPSHQQLLYGWPGGLDPGSSDTKLKDLGLPNKVGLFVATVDGGADADGAVASTSRGRTGTATNQNLEPDVTIELNVYDMLNEEPYDLPFRSRQTIQEVKKFVGEITGILPKHQEWSGWPKNAEDKQMLKDLELDKPFHSLVIMRAEPRNLLETH
ncbi:unnamed protein product [Orchesella dallaii]|uniref:Ubiquitin-like domain-containing protein n=1 Tax=Orchesella dallaii TaxID=48710 RepID=A0ABP1PWZ9_9HEXA